MILQIFDRRNACISPVKRSNIEKFWVVCPQRLIYNFLQNSIKLAKQLNWRNKRMNARKRVVFAGWSFLQIER